MTASRFIIINYGFIALCTELLISYIEDHRRADISKAVEDLGAAGQVNPSRFSREGEHKNFVPTILTVREKQS